MKRLVTILFTLILLAGNAHALTLFNVLDTSYGVRESLQVNVEYENGLTDHFERNFDQVSSGTISAAIEGQLNTPFSVDALAQEGYLQSRVYAGMGSVAESGIGYCYGGAQTEVWSDIVFQPLTDDGSGPVITFYHNSAYPYGNNVITITDNTTGINIFDPGWDMAADLRTVTFDYDAWDPTHTYTLRLALWGSTNAIGDQLYEMGTDLFSYINPTAVNSASPISSGTSGDSIPEPSMLCLIGFGLIGLSGLKRKRKKI